MAETRGYQFDYSEILPEAMYDRKAREKKAKTMVAVFSDYFKSDLKTFSVLDIGCSTGIITNLLASYFQNIIGMDIDEPAVEFAQKKFKRPNLEFRKGSSLNMDFPDSIFDVVICAHIYEHVPDVKLLMDEINRVLKVNGVCYFAAGNRYRMMEPHYHLPFLSAIPRPLAHIYIRLAGRSKYYYEKHLSYWGLKKLVRQFDIIDYTRHIIEQPVRFKADYMIRPNSTKAKLAKFISRRAYWLCPTYIWLLRKTAA
jgi:ubiquinone/menaquinone biosynthesis C-methylase UbiE